jgi:hypothetical protein
MCGASDNPRSVEPTITKQYRKNVLNKNGHEEPVGIGGWPPISTWITISEVSNNGGKYGRRRSTLNTGCKPRKGGVLSSKELLPTTLVIV